VLRLLGIVISIGIADSLNPTTIAPALYFASAERPRRRVAEFTIAVFTVYFMGGLLLTLGPGHLLLSLIPLPRHRVRYTIELAIGLAMLFGAGLLWRHRARLSEREPAPFVQGGRSSWVLGATITAIELPTAFPYFAAIAAIVSGTRHLTAQVSLLAIFNLFFVLPLIGITVTLTVAPSRAQELLGRGRDVLHAHWPRILAGAGVVVGLFIVLLGATGLAASPHNDFGQLMRRIHRSIPRP
jgi:cytochrome c biogenesis protein CcdA